MCAGRPHPVRRARRAALKRLRREYQDRRDAGLDHRWLAATALAREAALDSGGAIRTDGAALDPYRACLALAAAAATRGAAIYEQSPVRTIRAGRKSVEIGLARGTITADYVVDRDAVADPGSRALRRHLDARHSYVVVTEPLPAAVRRAVGRRATVLQDAGSPPHVLRWLKDDRVLFAGAGQPEVPSRLRDKTLVQRTGQLMYRALDSVPSHLRPPARVVLGPGALRNCGPPPVRGASPQLPPPFVRIGTPWRRRGLCVAGRPDPAAADPGEPAKGDDLFAFTRVL